VRSALRFILLACLALSFTGCERGSVPTLIGKPAPDFTIQDSGKQVSLRDLRGKVVVLNFWASWCPPCVEETPSMVAMQKQLKDHVTVLSVSLDVDPAAYKRFVRDQGMSPPMVTLRDAQKRSSSLYGTFIYPETYIIDAQGILRRKFIGPVDWTKPEIIDYLKNI
jgi:cytochrome c biogenesis protein CcmG/thiol:disulfide interchange protein DsbE